MMTKTERQSADPATLRLAAAEIVTRCRIDDFHGNSTVCGSCSKHARALREWASENAACRIIEAGRRAARRRG